MHRQARWRGRRIRDFKATTEFSVSFCSQRAYLWCRDGKGPQREHSSQIISLSLLQSLLKFTHVSSACTPLIIAASENKGKLASHICREIMSIPSHTSSSFKSAWTFLLTGKDWEITALLEECVTSCGFLPYKPQPLDWLLLRDLSSASKAILWSVEGHRVLCFALKNLRFSN